MMVGRGLLVERCALCFRYFDYLKPGLEAGGG
jgi:hypothetical protein